MAKKKKAAKRPQQAEEVVPRQKNVLALRGSDAWKTWLDGFASHKGMPTTVLLDHALRELAKRDGYPDPPSRLP